MYSYFFSKCILWYPNWQIIIESIVNTKYGEPNCDLPNCLGFNKYLDEKIEHSKNKLYFTQNTPYRYLFISEKIGKKFNNEVEEIKSIIKSDSQISQDEKKIQLEYLDEIISMNNNYKYEKKQYEFVLDNIDSLYIPEYWKWY